jgi:uncharacterized protein
LTKTLSLAPSLALPAEVVTQKLAFLAQSGAGKSYAAMKLAEEMLTFGAQVVALDPVGVWWGLRVAADGKKPGIPITVFGGEHGDVPLPPNAGAMVADLVVDLAISAVLDVSDFELPEMKRFVAAFFERFFQRKKRSRSPVHVFLEEAQTFAPQYPERDETVMLNRVERTARIGRNYGIGWSAISQRPQEVHKKVLNQAGTLFALRTIGKHERDAVAAWVSDKARSKEELDLLEGLPALETGVARVWSPAFLRLTAEVKIGRRRTFDSSATPESGVVTVEPKALAAVDVERLKDALATYEEEQRANDPRELKKRIAELERQLRAAQAGAPPAPEVRVETKVERVEVPAIATGVVARFEECVSELLQLGVTISEGLEAVKNAPSLPATFQTLPPPPEPKRAAAVNTVRKTTPLSTTRTEQPADIDLTLTPRHMALLNILATFDGLGVREVDRRNAFVLAGWSPRSSASDLNASRLRAHGYVDYPRDGAFAITEKGLAVAKMERIRSLAELHEAWFRVLDDYPANLLRTLIRRYPAALDRQALADETGVSLTSSRFDQSVSQLNALGVAHYPSKGSVAATPLLFPEGLR